MIGRDGAAGLFCFAGAVALFVASRGLPQSTLVPIGPGFYPRILFVVTAVISAAVVVVDVMHRDRPRFAPARYRLVLLTFAAFGAYVALLPALGYRLATLLFVGGLGALLDPPRSTRSWILLGVVAVLSSVITYVVFEHYLSVLLPRGRLTGF